MIVLLPCASVYSSTSPVNISQTPGNIIIEQNSVNPQIITAGKNEYVIWIEDRGEDRTRNGPSGDIYFKRSSDGGASFDRTINLSNTTGRASNSNMAVSGNSIYVTWLHYTGSIYSVYFKKSTDGGASFDRTINLGNIIDSPRSELDYTTLSELDTIVADTRYPSIVAADNNVYVIWLGNITKTSKMTQNDSETAHNDIIFRRSTDEGSTFGDTLNLSNSTSITENPHLAVAGSNVYLVWNGVGDETSGIYFRRSTNEGGSFEPAVNIIYNTEKDTSWLDNPQIFALDTKVYVIYEQSYSYSSSSSMEQRKSQLFFTSSHNAGSVFDRPIRLNDNNGVGDNAQMVAVGKNVYVVWPTDIIDKGRDSFGLRYDMYLRRSINEGGSFEPIFDLSKGLIKGSSANPLIEANGTNVYLVWEISVDKELPYYSGNQVVFVHIPILAKSVDDGANFDIIANVTGSDSDLSLSENNVALVWSQDGEVFFKKVSSALPLSSLRPSNIRISNIHNVSEPVAIDGRIGNAEWERVPSSSLEQSNDTNFTPSWERIRTTTHQWSDKDYEINPAATYDNKNAYFVFGVQGTGFVGGSNLTLMFDNSHNGKLDDGDDVLKIIGGLDSARSKENFEDSFWNNATGQIQKDENYGGKEDGYVSSSFYNGTEVFEVSHPLCSTDHTHDFCITNPNQLLGFSLKFEVNNSSALLFFDDLDFDTDRDMYPFSLSKGGVYDDCPGCTGAPLPTLIPPAAYILEPIQRLSASERTQLLNNLTSNERTELLNSPTQEGVKNFLRNKLTAEELGDFLRNKLTAEETDKLFKSIPEDEILNRLGDEDRKAVLDKLSSFQLAK